MSITNRTSGSSSEAQLLSKISQVKPLVFFPRSALAQTSPDV